MKKIFSILAMSVMICGFISCGNSKTPTTEQIENVAEKEVIDTVEVDTNDVMRGDAEGQGFDITYSTQSVSSAGNDRYRKFVKTRSRCSKCSCSGYWGYKHYNGTYEGNCSNSDGHGHTCGHGPEKHGLRRW